MRALSGRGAAGPGYGRRCLEGGCSAANPLLFPLLFALQDQARLYRKVKCDCIKIMAVRIRMKHQQKADLALVLVAAFWGSSTLLTKMGLEGMAGFNLIALRFVIAFFLAAPLFWKRLKNAGLITVKYAAWLAAILFVTFVFFTFGISATSVSNAGFLSCLSGIFVPIIGFLFLKQRPDLKTVLCIILVFVGVYLLTFSGRLQLNLGDLLCILCSLSFALHIIATGHCTRRISDSFLLGFLQLGFVALYALVFSFAFEKPCLPQTAGSYLIVLALSIFATAFSYILQTAALKYTTATRAGLILSLEPVFAAVCACVWGGEVLTLGAYLGALIMLAGIVLVEIDFKSKARLNGGERALH